jgi:cell division protein FtsA
VDAHVVAASSSFLQNMCKTVQRANLEIDPDGLISGAIASALAVLTEEERKLGTAMIDIGAGTLDLAVYCEGEVGHSAVLPVAGDLLTHDLARFFRIPPSQAERLKLEKGLASPEFLEQNADELLQAKTLSGEGLVEVPRGQMAEVLEARLLDMFEWVGGELQRAERLGLVVSSLVLTGGTSQLPGIAQLAHRELNMPCRVASPCYPQGLSEALASPIFSGSIGLLLHGAARRFLPQDKGEVKSSKFRQVVHSVSRWLAEVF